MDYAMLRLLLIQLAEYEIRLLNLACYWDGLIIQQI